MKQNYLHDQRGIAMVVELMLVAVVLSLVGVAVYQSNSHKPTASKVAAPAAVSATGLATSAASIGLSESAADASISASADSSADQLKDSDVDVTNLGGSTSANSF
ncbi:MAG: hypothetical protein NVSMB39_3040 [Candidatus Saccharimonadales bacterium]